MLREAKICIKAGPTGFGASPPDSSGGGSALERAHSMGIRRLRPEKILAGAVRNVCSIKFFVCLPLRVAF